MKASSAVAWLAAGLATLVAAAPAGAQGPVELSRAPIPEDAAWKSYVIGTGTADVAPVRIASVSGSVTNAEGLVDPSKGPVTLTYAAGGQAPVVILDYGREVGGLPFFTASAVTPAPTGTSVTLRSAYSETRQFLYSAGNTTLTLPAAAGDTNLKVAGVNNFIAGDTLRIGADTATITAVGTQARSTTLFAAAAAGATNVKVATTTGLAAGDALRVDGETVTIATVGTQGRNTTLSAATTAGATNIKVASVTGMAAGDPIVVDGESGTIQTVGTAGAAGTGVTLTAALANAHASGAAVQDLGTGITFAPALAAAHAGGAPVIAPGTGITISAPLSAAQAAGTTVRGTPGALTGDANGFNGVGVAASRAENWTFSAPGTLGNAANAIQGGERFQSLTLTTPGTIALSAVGIHVRYPNAGAGDYVGHFLSSDEKLNKIWYQGAYTNDTNMVPIGAVPNQTIPVILDGAKRDRRPWSGDLDLQGKTMFSSLGFGAKGSDYIKGSILLFGASQAANGSIFGHIQDWTRNPPAGGFYSLSYSMYYVLNLASYYLYSGDLDFVRSQYATVQRQLAYNRALVDPATGLLISNSSERDWDFYDGGKPGAVTAYNAIYYKALSDAAQMASELGNMGDAATYAAQAADLKQRINATLFDATRGVYKLADRDNANHAGDSVPQDANSEAISFGIAPASAHAGILGWLRTNLWEPFGPQPYSSAANYSTVISPFVTGKELDARFHAGDTQGALDLTHLMWDQMTNENGPVLHRHDVGEAQPRRHRRRCQREPLARLGDGADPGAEPLRARRAAGHRGLQDVAGRAADRRSEVGAGHGPDPAGRARLALDPW